MIRSFRRPDGVLLAAIRPFRSQARRALHCSLILLIVACSDSTEPRVPASISFSTAPVSFDAIGASRVIKATVSDRANERIRRAAINWSSSSDAVTVIGLGGDSARVTAVSNGSANISASSGPASGTLGVVVDQLAATLQKIAGDGQNGAAGLPLPTPLQVRVVDRLGVGVADETVAFSVTQGGGSVTPLVVTSGPDGIASATWTVGSVAGGANQVTATLASVSPAISALFTATTRAGAPATMGIVAGNNQTAPVGTPVPIQPSVRTVDAFNNPIAGHSVNFAVVTGNGSLVGSTQSTNADGIATLDSWILGAEGLNQLSATAAGTTVSVVFDATGTAATSGGAVASISIASQAAMVSNSVASPPSIMVRDAAGNPRPGLTVTFTVTGGGGFVTGATTTTNASGVATVGSWTLGPVFNLNTLEAKVTNSPLPLAGDPFVFNAAGCSGGGGVGYAITLCGATALNDSQTATFVAAADKWRSIITSDPNNISLTGSAPCGPDWPILHLTVDDLLVFVATPFIDGPGGVLGSAGPCLIRGNGGVPAVGVMRFDAADISSLQTSGRLLDVVIHEMGHVIGIGTMWGSPRFLLQNSSTPDLANDTYYSGIGGMAGFDAVGGTSYLGPKVPVENTGGQGTINAHWRESVLNQEMMTGFVEQMGPNPLSLVSVRSLEDLGYTVNTSAADPYTLPPPGGRVTSGTAIPLGNDIYAGPLYTLDALGRVVRIR